MSENPYSSPLSQSTGRPAGAVPSGNDSFVRQVPVVGILMIVFGSLEFLMGCYYCFVGFLMPESMFVAQARQGNPMPAEQVEFMKQIMYWTCTGMGSAGMAGGLFRLLGGIQVVRFRSHVFGIVANMAGLASIATCYCLPTSIGISVYGLIVLFHSSVRQEFARRAS